MTLTSNSINEEATNTRTTGLSTTSRFYFFFTIAILSLTMISSMDVLLGTIARASLCLALIFVWRRRCMLWIDFVASVGNFVVDGCVGHNNCTSNLRSLVDQYHHICVVSFSRVFICIFVYSSLVDGWSTSFCGQQAARYITPKKIHGEGGT